MGSQPSLETLTLQHKRTDAMNQSSETSAIAASEVGIMRTTPFALGALFRHDIFILFGIFVLFYYFKLSTFSISIDDEFGAVRESSDVWIRQGRWGVYLIERLFMRQPVVPFFPFFIFGCSLSISYPIILSAFGVRELKVIHYIAFPLYVAFPIWIFALSFFSNTVAFGLGHLLVVCALGGYRAMLDALPESWPDRFAWGRAAALLLRSSLFAAIAIGMYQSFALSVATVGLAILMSMSLTERFVWRAVIYRCMLLTVTLAVAAGLYQCIQSVFVFGLGLGGQGYVGNFLNLGALWNSPVETIAKTAQNALAIYGGQSDVFGSAAFAFPLTICSGLGALAFWPHASYSKRLLLLLVAGTMLALPFSLHVLSGGQLPARTLVSLPAVVWFLAMIGCTCPIRWLARISFACILISSLQILYIVNLLQTSNEFARKHDESLSAAIYARVVSVDPGHGTNRLHTIDFYGSKPFNGTFPRPMSGTLGYSFFEWDGGNIERIVTYMHLLGYADVQSASLEQRRQDLNLFKSMPIWPDHDSVRTIGDVTLVKLGPDPGWPFQ